MSKNREVVIGELSEKQNEVAMNGDTESVSKIGRIIRKLQKHMISPSQALRATVEQVGE